MQYDIAAARKEGIPDFEIANALAPKLKYDLRGARDAGVSDSEIADALADRFNKTNLAPDTATYTGRKAAEGAANFVGMFADAPNRLYQLGRAAVGAGPLPAVMSAITGKPKSEYMPEVGDPDAATKGIKRLLGIDRPMVPTSDTQRYAGAIAEFAGGNIIPGAGIVGAAAHKIPAALAVGGSSIFGGLGSEGGGDISQSVVGSRVPGEIIGGIAGSVYGSGLPNVASKVSSLVGAKTGAPYAARRIEGAIASHPFADNIIKQSDETVAGVSNLAGRPFNPSIAERTDAVGVKAMQDDVLRRSTKGVEAAQLNRRQNVDTLMAARENAFPQGSNISRAADTVLRKTQGELDSRLKQIDFLERQAAENLPPARLQQIGERLVGLRDEAFKTAKIIKDQRVKDLYDTGRNVAIDTADIVAPTQKIIASDSNSFQKMPDALKAIVSKWAGQADDAGKTIVDAAGNPVSKTVRFDEFHSGYREINRQIGVAMRAKDFQQLNFLGDLKRVAVGKLKAIEAETGNPIATKLADFNKFYADKYHAVFREGVGGKIVDVNKFGSTTKPEDVVKMFFTPSGMDDFAAIYGNNEIAQRQLKDGIVGMFAESAIKNGKINQSAAANFLRNNAETLNRVPDVKSLLSSQSAFETALRERTTNLVKTKREIGNSILADIAKSSNTEEWIAKNIGNRKAMMQIATLPDKGARMEAAREISNKIPDIAAKAGLPPSEFLEKNAATLKPLLDRLGDGHFDNLRTISRGMEMMSRWKPPQHPDMKTVLPDPLEAAIGTSIPSAVSQYRATTVTRQSSPTHMFTSMGVKLMNKLRMAGSDKAMEAAFFDPEVAKELKKSMLIQHPSNKLLDQLAVYGAVSVAESQQQ